MWPISRWYLPQMQPSNCLISFRKFRKNNGQLWYQLILCDLALPSYLNYCTRVTWHVMEENRIILLSICHSIMIKGLLNGKYKRSECRVKVYTLNSLLLTVLLQRLWVSSKKFCIDLSFIIYQIVMNKSRSLMAFPD